MIRSRSQAEADLGRHVDDFVDCVRGAITEFLRDYAALRHGQSPRSQASLISDNMRRRFRERFAEESGVTILERNNIMVADFSSHYILKLKKFDPMLRTHGVATQAKLDFVNQAPLPESVIPGWPAPATHLHLGYQPMGVELETADIFLVCPDGEDQLHWSWPLDTGLGAIPFPIEPEPDAPRRARVTKKADAADGEVPARDSE